MGPAFFVSVCAAEILYNENKGAGSGLPGGQEKGGEACGQTGTDPVAAGHRGGE